MCDVQMPTRRPGFTFHYVSIKSTSMYCIALSGLSFTFHYVSIKSLLKAHSDLLEPHLHSTMFLLNLAFTASPPTCSPFTFHYVSIKSNIQGTCCRCLENLHSTMFLLNHGPLFSIPLVSEIYIPLCFY